MAQLKFYFSTQDERDRKEVENIWIQKYKVENNTRLVKIIFSISAQEQNHNSGTKSQIPFKKPGMKISKKYHEIAKPQIINWFKKLKKNLTSNLYYQGSATGRVSATFVTRDFGPGFGYKILIIPWFEKRDLISHKKRKKTKDKGFKEWKNVIIWESGIRLKNKSQFRDFVGFEDFSLSIF